MSFFSGIAKVVKRVFASEIIGVVAGAIFPPLGVAAGGVLGSIAASTGVGTAVAEGIALGAEGLVNLAGNAAANNLINKQLGNKAISSVSTSMAVSLVRSVAINTNYALNDIPKNLIGLHNPVDIRTSNFGPDIIQKVILPNIQNSILTTVNLELNKKITNLLVFNAPQDVINILGLDKLKSQIIAGLQPAINRSILLVLESYLIDLYNRGLLVPPIVKNIPGFFSGGNSIYAIQKYTEVYNQSQVQSALSRSQNFNVLNKDNISILETSRKLGVDPTGTYPTPEYKNQPEVNKLARGDVQGTIVQRKEEDRLLGARLPNDQTWNQPPSPYKAVYPNNKVFETPSGHLIELDDSPGAERIHLYHKSGTFMEIDSSGSITKKAKGSSYEIIEKNGKIFIGGQADISVTGACNIFVGNDANIEVEGNTNIRCHNDIIAEAAGNFKLSAAESFSIRSANVFIEADNELQVLAENKIVLNTQGDLHANADSEMYFTSYNSYNSLKNSQYFELLGEFNVSATGDALITSKNYFGVTSESYYHQSLKDINLKANELIKTQGDEIHFNSPSNLPENSEQAATGIPLAINSENSLAGVLENRKIITRVEIPDPSVIGLAQVYVSEVEEPEASKQEKEKVKNTIITRGFVPQEKLEENPVKLEEYSPSTNQVNIVSPSEELIKLNRVPENFKLSPGFTLGMLTTKTAVSNYPLRAQKGLKYGEILYNLQAIALNVCEPIKTLYPMMFITSCFRHDNNSPNSDHALGKAVDIQFKGFSKDQYYQAAKELSKVINYDKFILEYNAAVSRPWIHISFGINANRKLVYTMVNNEIYSQSLVYIGNVG